MGASSHPQPNVATKKFGQDYQFAETWSNPPPEFVVGSGSPPAATATAGASGLGGDGADEANTTTTNPDGSMKERDSNQEAVWTPPEDPWYRRFANMKWMIIGITTLGITAVILAILGAMGILTGQSSSSSAGDSSPSSTTSSSSILSMSQTTTFSTSTTAGPRPTGIANECSNNSKFKSDILMVQGTSPTDTGMDFPAGRESAEECCSACYQTENCIGWLHNPDTQYTPCTIIFLKVKKTGQSGGMCPLGKSLTVFTGGAKMSAGVGPCSNGEK